MKLVKKAYEKAEKVLKDMLTDKKVERDEQKLMKK